MTLILKIFHSFRIDMVKFKFDNYNESLINIIVDDQLKLHSHFIGQNFHYYLIRLLLTYEIRHNYHSYVFLRICLTIKLSNS